MSGWATSVGAPGYKEKSIRRGAAAIIIYRPILDAESRATQESKTSTALEGAMREYFKGRK